ncbi:MAG: DHHA1 domain-containing protein, partial [Planctomycetaceae bacterium]
AKNDHVLNATPFSAEAGGQVGDVGTIGGAHGRFEVLDTQKHKGLVVHRGRLLSGRLAVNDEVRAEVVSDRRAGIRRAHSATHLLHHALRTVLGEHAMQRGSKVEDDWLRFDFAHGTAVAAEELSRIEDLINERIAEGAAVSTEYMDIRDAKAAGATALFGEKYPDRVRVVSMGGFSKELCGGTHLANTGQVGLCKIIGEESVSSGVRRVTALTGQRALERVRETEDLLRQLVALLKTPQPEDLPRRVEQLQDELREARRELQKATRHSVAGTVDELLSEAEEVSGVKIVTHAPPNANRETLRQFADQLRARNVPVAILLGAVEDGKVALTAAVSKDLIARGIKAGDAVKVAAKLCGGGGGGRADLAEAGGKLPDKLPEALEAGRAFYREKLQAAS